MKDFIGNELQIGDRVAYARNPYSNLMQGIVVEFTPKKIRVGETIIDIKSSNLVFTYQVVKVFNQNER